MSKLEPTIQWRLFSFWIVLALIARLLPHPPNFTPYASLIALAGCQLSKRMALFITLVSLVLSDILLGMFLGYPVFGFWTLFTYSGFIAMAYVSSAVLHQHRSALRIAVLALGSVLGYWLWTNFGTWLVTDLYPHSAAGLLTCFVAALPFLKMSALADLMFVPLFFLIIVMIENTFPTLKKQEIE